VVGIVGEIKKDQLTGDVACTVELTEQEAVQGKTFTLTVMDHRVKITLPPGLQSGNQIKLPNAGESKAGDQAREVFGLGGLSTDNLLNLIWGENRHQRHRVSAAGS
jgi:hypothetical protein